MLSLVEGMKRGPTGTKSLSPKCLRDTGEKLYRTFVKPYVRNSIAFWYRKYLFGFQKQIDDNLFPVTCQNLLISMQLLFWLSNIGNTLLSQYSLYLFYINKYTPNTAPGYSQSSYTLVFWRQSFVLCREPRVIRYIKSDIYSSLKATL